MVCRVSGSLIARASFPLVPRDAEIVSTQTHRGGFTTRLGKGTREACVGFGRVGWRQKALPGSISSKEGERQVSA